YRRRRPSSRLTATAHIRAVTSGRPGACTPCPDAPRCRVRRSSANSPVTGQRVPDTVSSMPRPASKESAVADIVWFTDAESTDNSVTGGKGANLGVLAQAGFEVPPGFAITTSAYTTFLVESGLDRQIAAALDGLDYGDLATVEDVTSGIRALIAGAQVPGALGAAIAAAHGELGAEYVAVRSSGAAEDLADASFAGLHDTYLDVQGADDTVDAVKRCWASL